MSTRNFCDLCEAPAVNLEHIEAKYAFGEPYEGVYDGGFKTKQARIVARVVYTIEENKGGFRGPPDLCVKCAWQLVAAAARVLGKEIAGATPS